MSNEDIIQKINIGKCGWIVWKMFNFMNPLKLTRSNIVEDEDLKGWNYQSEYSETTFNLSKKIAFHNTDICRCVENKSYWGLYKTGT